MHMKHFIRIDLCLHTSESGYSYRQKGGNGTDEERYRTTVKQKQPPPPKQKSRPWAHVDDVL